MQKNLRVLITICLLLLFPLNYTFSIHREARNLNFANNTIYGFLHQRFISKSPLEYTKTMNKKSAQEYARICKSPLKRAMENKLSEEDLRQYKQLVIMKKYPYLDLKELELKYSPFSNKNARQSYGNGIDVNLRSDINLEPEEGLNVEIINRGLSGFSIPQKAAKAAVVENKSKLNRLNFNGNKFENTINKKSPKRAR